MKLIHCSDLHLDSRMETNLSPEQARVRVREICGTFLRLCSYARENGAAAVILAGDLFDTERVKAQTADLVLSAMEESPEVDFLYLRGNHDEGLRAFQGRKLPQNLHFFGSDWKTYRYGQVAVTGCELTDDNCMTLYDSLSLSGQDVNIVTLHGQVSTRRGPELVSLPDLRNQHIRYLALGHLHSYHLEKLDPEGELCYCGTPDGRGFDETGPKGFVELNWDRQVFSHRFVPFSSRNLWQLRVDISGLLTLSQLRDRLLEAGKEIPQQDLVKFVLTGTYTPETRKDLPYLLELLEGRYWFVKLSDETALELDRSTYEHDISLKGEFVRLVMGSQESPEDRDRIITLGLQALRGEELEP